MEMKTSPYAISVGPLLYYWPRQQVLDFYEQVAASPADIAYLGETVCSRRHELRAEDWLAIADTLQAAGKTPILSSQTLIETSADANTLRRLCKQDSYAVEAGDLGAVRLMAGRPFVGGMHLNLYHGDTLRWLHGLGCHRVVLPVEMDRNGIAALLAEKPPYLAIEMMVWGRMPLAFSSRCFTARHFRLKKDECGFRCIEHPDGLAMRTRDEQDFLAINGIQTQSGHCLDLLSEACELARLGVGVLRVSPHSGGTFEALAALDAQRHGQAAEAVTPPAGIGRCNGYWYGQAGIALQGDVAC